MILLNFSQAVEYLQGTSYFILFILMIIEGPIVTSAAAFLASLGFFNIFIIFILSIFGDLIGDCLHYSIGRYGGHKLINKYYKKFNISKKDINKTKRGLHKHFGKTMFIIKFTPIFTTPGLIIMGSLKSSLKKFVVWSLLVTLPKTLFFVLMGYYFGVAIEKIIKYYSATQYFIILLMLLIILSYLAYKRFFLKSFKS